MLPHSLIHAQLQTSIKVFEQFGIATGMKINLELWYLEMVVLLEQMKSGFTRDLKLRQFLTTSIWVLCSFLNYLGIKPSSVFLLRKQILVDISPVPQESRNIPFKIAVNYLMP